MEGCLVRMCIGMGGLWLAAALVPGIAIEGTGTLILAALLLGFVNAVVRPVFIVLTFPLTVVTLGLFLLVVNAAMLGLVAALLDGFRIAGFFSALAGSLVVSAVGWLASWYVGPRGRMDVLVVRNRRD